MMYKYLFLLAVFMAAGFLLVREMPADAQSSTCTSALIALLGDGCHYMYNDSAGNPIYCNSAMTISAKSGDTAVTQGCSSSSTSNTSYSSCSSALSALLGSGCHYMYTDSAGRAIYCNSEMTVSAKEGDAATTSGCSSATTSTTTTTVATTTTTTSASCISSLIALLGEGCHYMYNDSAGNPIYCNSAMTISAKSGDTAVTQGCSSSSTTSSTSGTTSATGQAPILSNVTVSDIHDVSTTITWNTDKLSTSKVEYWIGSAYGAFKEDAAYATYHAVQLTGLQPATTYSFNALSRDANYYTGYAYNRTFTTLGSSQTTATATTTTTVATATTTITTATTTTTTTTGSCPSGYHYMYPYASGSAGYCMSDTNSSACQPIGGGAIYACSGTSSTATATTTAITGSGCDSVLFLLLGSGCHYMYNDSAGNPVYCNGEMTVSAKKGDAAVTQGCSYSGGIAYSATTTIAATSGCDSILAALLGSGCHYMYNDSSGNPIYCNGAMTQSAKKGDTAITQGCSSSGVAAGFAVTSAYSAVESDGRVRVTVVFSRQVDQTTLTESNIGMFRVADGSAVAGKISAYASGFEYFTFSPPTGGFSYEVRVKKNIRDEFGTGLTADYATPPFVVSGGASKTFAVDPSRTFPAQNGSAVDGTARIRVGFTKAIDPDSLKTQFFSLVNMANSSVSLSGSFFILTDGFDFTPSLALEPGAKYLYTVFAVVKDATGAVLSAPFSASFSTASTTAKYEGQIAGTVTDGAGNPVGRAFVYISRSDFSFSRNIETGADGTFSSILPEGTYRVEVFSPLGRGDLIKPDVATVAVRPGIVAPLSFRFGASVKTITGLVLFASGSPVLDAEVSAYSSESGQQMRGIADGKGRYTLRVDGGVWQVGIRPKDPANASWSYIGIFPKVSFSQDAIAETQIADFTVPVSDGKLIIRTIDQNGAPVAGAGVIADTAGSAQTQTDIRASAQFKTSDASGSAAFFVRGGTYYLRGSLPLEFGFLNPEEQSVSVYSGETRTVTLTFRKRDAVATVFLSGATRLENGAPTDAFVWAWSEKGGFANIRSDQNGTFRMQVPPSERWHIGAGKEISGVPYKAPEVIVAVGTSDIGIELFLSKLRDALPPPVSATQSATQQVVVEAQDGAKITVPPAAVAGSGAVQIEVKPTIEAPSQAAAQVVSTVYEVTVRDAAGKEITQLKDNAEIVLPYNEDDLKKEGVTEDAIAPSFFDEKTASWVKIADYTVDKDKNIIIARVAHLTRFAIVAAADVIPPVAPANISASVLGNGKIKIAWTNPGRDFSHAKVYKSERQGIFGEVLAAEARGTTVTDSAVRDGVVYYYAVRAVDPAGNESGNTDQSNARAVGTSARLLAVAPKSAAEASVAMPQKMFARNLRLGNSGDDIKTLQSFLLKEGTYPEGLVTGYFGAYTKQAVIRFQEKYASEILVPFGLTKGNGFVGPWTRKKMNSLLMK